MSRHPGSHIPVATGMILFQHARQSDLIFAIKTYCEYLLMVMIPKTVSQIDVCASWIPIHEFIFVDSSMDSDTCPTRPTPPLPAHQKFN